MSILHIVIGIVAFVVAWLIIYGSMYGIAKLIAICIFALVNNKGIKE